MFSFVRVPLTCTNIRDEPPTRAGARGCVLVFICLRVRESGKRTAVDKEGISGMERQQTEWPCASV